MLEALDFLEKKDMKDCLKLIHFHIGSQVTKIRRIKTALREACLLYTSMDASKINVLPRVEEPAVMKKGIEYATASVSYTHLFKRDAGILGYNF